MAFKNAIKAIFLCGAVALMVILFACRKGRVDKQTESQGTTFNHLLKTITTDKTTGAQRTVKYSYDGAGLIIQITTEASDVSGTSATTESFYRNAAGQLDSIGWIEKTGGIITSVSQVSFSYDANGSLVASRDFNQPGYPPFDSSLYLYAGCILKTRLDYRNTGNNSYNLFLQVDYEFDGNGNMTQAIFQQFGNFQHVDTVSFQYDNKINPVPAGPLMFYLQPIYYNDYRAANNLTRAFSPDVDSYSFEGYTYSSNNKPLYRKEITTGGTGFAETYYYYD